MKGTPPRAPPPRGGGREGGGRWEGGKVTVLGVIIRAKGGRGGVRGRHRTEGRRENGMLNS